MTSWMNPLERSQPTRATEVVSPELVLVGPSARASSTRFAHNACAHGALSLERVRGATQMSLVIAAEPRRERAPYDDLVAPRRKQSAWLTVCVALGIVVAILLSDVRVEPGTSVRGGGRRRGTRRTGHARATVEAQVSRQPRPSLPALGGNRSAIRVGSGGRSVRLPVRALPRIIHDLHRRDVSRRASSSCELA